MNHGFTKNGYKHIRFFSRLSRLCREVFPGQTDDVDFFAGWQS